jgi:hypothetical protein
VRPNHRASPPSMSARNSRPRTTTINAAALRRPRAVDLGLHSLIKEGGWVAPLTRCDLISSLEHLRHAALTKGHVVELIERKAADCDAGVVRAKKNGSTPESAGAA